MADSSEQAAFIAALGRKADELAASNPVIAEVRSVGKALVAEVRRRVSDKNEHTSLGAYLAGGSVSLIDTASKNTKEASAEILSKLTDLARTGKIEAAGTCSVIDKQVPGGNIVKFVDVHIEHSTGKALTSLVPVDESFLLRSVPGTQGPSVAISGGPTKPRIFATTEASVLKIAVMADGSITVDGSPATVESARVALRSLAQQNGVVWYYREGGTAPAPPQANEIIKAVIENRLSIRLSSRPDYSDAIGPDGKPLPLKPTTK